MAHHHHQSQVSGRRLALATWLNIFITLGQAVGGWLSGSLALLADALHNFSDVVALVVTYIARRLSNRASTPQQTFGYKRAEIIAAFINASSLLLIAVFIGRSAFLRLFGETPPIISEWVIGLALGSILVNGGSVWLLHAGKRESLNLRAAYLHLFTDLLTSIAVLIGGLVMLFYDLRWIDAMLSLFIATYLVIAAWRVVLQSLRVLMQFAPADMDIEKVRALVVNHPMISDLHHIHLWQINDNEVSLEAHVRFSSDLLLSESTKIIASLKAELEQSFGISHCLLQPEYGSRESDALLCGEDSDD